MLQKSGEMTFDTPKGFIGNQVLIKILNESWPFRSPIFSLATSFFAMAIPFYFGFPLPSKGKEHFLLIYPIVTIPLLLIGATIRGLLYK